MRAPVIHRLGNAFDERNPFLHVTLGTISLLRQFKDILRRCGGHRAPGETMPADDDSEGDPEFLHLVLGLCALSQHAMRHLPATRQRRTALPAEEAASAPVARRAPPIPRGILD